MVMLCGGDGGACGVDIDAGGLLRWHVDYRTTYLGDIIGGVLRQCMYIAFQY